MKGDIEKLHIALLNETGTDCYDKIIGRDTLVIVNRCRYIDFMQEVIVGGVRIGKMYYDPILKELRFRWSYDGALKAVQYGLCDTLIVRSSKLREGMLMSLNRSYPAEKQIILVNQAYDPVGIGYVTRKGLRVRDVFIYKRKTPKKMKKSTIDDAIKANKEYLRRKESKAIATLWKYARRSLKPIYVAYSGGKDSGLVLHLALEAGITFKAVFNDTSMELPETLQHIDDFVSDKGVDLIRTKPIVDFWTCARKLGPPSVIYRWCTRVLKLAPMNSLLKGGALVIDGMRRGESTTRHGISIIRTSESIPWALYLSPIINWSALDEWLYIFWRKIKYNPLYDNCFDRVGCFMCPTSTLFEYAIIKEKHPSVWNRWEAFIEQWREGHSLPKEWATYALWRWEGKEKALKDLCKHIGANYTITYRDKMFKNVLKEISYSSNTYCLSLKKTLDLKRTLGLALTENWSIVNVSHEVVMLERNRVKMIISRGGKIIIQNGTHSDLISALRIVLRTNLCTSCASCNLSCPNNAINRGEVDINKCTSCGICTYICPISNGIEKLISQILPAQLLRNLKRSQLKPTITIRREHLLTSSDETPQLQWPVFLENSLL